MPDRRLPSLIERIDQVAPELWDYYRATDKGYELSVQVTEEPPKPAPPAKRRSQMSAEEKARAITRLGRQGYMDLPW